ncbi:MAG: dihydroorotase [Rickettsiales bacterium]|nr:dihydroorotase [Rickettsiales bacterium]
MNKIAFTNAFIIDPTQNINSQGVVLVEKRNITKLIFNNSENFTDQNYKIINCKGFTLSPGFVDIKCHLRVPGDEHKENLSYASQSAASAGITSLVCMPNTDPIIDNVSIVELLQRKARKESDVKIYSTASITKGLQGKDITEIGLLKEAGAVGFTDAIKAVDDASVMLRALKYASAFDVLIMQHPEEKNLSKGGSMNSGLLSTKLGIKGIPIEAEVLQVDRDIRLAEMTKSKIHFFNITTQLSIDSIKLAQKRGAKVTCSTSPHYFNLSEEDIRKWRTYAKVSPPLRDKRNMDAVKSGIVNNIISCISSDHSPHDTDSKRLPFEQASSGIIGFESLLPLTLKLIKEKKLPLSKLIELLSSNPAKLLDLNAGSLKIGKPADIVIFNPNKNIKLSSELIKSKSKNFPYENINAKGKVILTMVDGKIVYNARSFNFK